MHEIYADYGIGAVGVLVSGLTFLLGRFVWVLIDNVDFQRAAQRAWKEVRDAVAEVNQTYVRALKAGKEPSSDGGSRLTDAEKAEARGRALAIAKANIGKKGLRRLARVIGVDVDRWLGTRLEAAVSETKPSIAVLSSPDPS